MRNLSPAVQQALSQNGGLEPVLILKVFWASSNGASTNYCDRKFDQEGLEGKLLTISGIEDVVDINNSSNSISLSVTLDDSDGSIKAIYDTIDIHKTYVQVLQWFSQLPLSDAFIIFEGEINSPIIWEEGVRTLKFDVISQLQDREVGFSAEEGKFDFLPTDIIGVAWPIIFGQVFGAKALPLNVTPTARLARGYGVVNEEEWQKEFDDMQAAIDELSRLERNAYLSGIGNALKAAQYKRFNTGGFPDDPEQADQYDTAASYYYAQSSDYAAEKLKLQLEMSAKQEQLRTQRDIEGRNIVEIIETNLPTSGRYYVQIGNYLFEGTPSPGSLLTLSNPTLVQEELNTGSLYKPGISQDANALSGTNTLVFNDQVNRYDQTKPASKFTWFEAGTEIKLRDFPRVYVVSVGVVNIANVWGQSKYGRTVIPPSWYWVTVEAFGPLIITKLTFPEPLENRPGEWVDGDIEIDAVSQLSNNPVAIMEWAITNFSSFGIDAGSFGVVAAQTAAFPANFVLTERMNVVEFLRAIAFQARCAIWLNDRKFFLRFLPAEYPSIDTITDSDIEVGSLSITSAPTEELVTKFVATWKQRSNQDKPYKIIYRYNIQKYGTHEETYDFFMYKDFGSVSTAAQFWMIRKSMSWKIVKCKLTLNKLKLEAFDTVTFDLNNPVLANGPIKGIIQRALYDPDNDVIDMEAWLPVRLGEMEQYTFAYPGDTSLIFPVVGDQNIQTGNPWEEASGTPIQQIYLPKAVPLTFSHFNPDQTRRTYTSGTGIPANAPPETTPADIVTVLTPWPLSGATPEGLSTFNDVTRPKVNGIEPFEYKATVPMSFLGFIREKKSDTVYTCDVHMSGLRKAPTTVDVNIGYVGQEDDELKEGFPIVVYRSLFVDNSTVPPQPFVELWGQPTIWAPTNANTST